MSNVRGNEFPAVVSNTKEPIVALPIPKYIMGLNISVASTTVIALEPGQARDHGDVIDIPVGYPNYAGTVLPKPNFFNCPSPLYINSGVVGANGLDVGVLAASSFYIVYLIADSSGFNPAAGLLSLYSNQYPLLPKGYDSYRIIGFVGTDGSTHFTAGSVLNSKFEKSYFLQPYVSVLAGGNATTFTAIDLSTPIPTTTDPFVIAYINVIFTPANVGDTVQFRPTTSTATSGIVTIVGVAAGVPQVECVAVMTGVGSSKPEIDYKVSVSGDSVSVLVEGYEVTLS